MEGQNVIIVPFSGTLTDVHVTNGINEQLHNE